MPCLLQNSLLTAGYITGGLTGEDCVGMKMGLGNYRRRRQEQQRDPKLTPLDKRHFSFLPELLMVHQEAGLRVLNPETAAFGELHALAMPGLGWWQGGIWLCPSARRRNAKWLQHRQMETFYSGKGRRKTSFFLLKPKLLQKILR